MTRRFPNMTNPAPQLPFISRFVYFIGGLAIILGVLSWAGRAHAEGCTYDNNGRVTCARLPQGTSGHLRAHARHRVASRQIDASGNGIVRSRKTGATAHVSPTYSALFQSYVNDLEAAGASVRFMGGYRRGPCWSGGLHPCGKALDVCQLSRGRVDGRCHLPGPSVMAAIASRNGLFEGGQWCHSDYGHAQVGMSAAPCRSNLYAAVRKFHRRRMRVAKRTRTQ